jgi:catechol 2,3-dioxygenase-like lactoylglutathione lyase family enzyme
MFDNVHHVQLAMPRGEEAAARAFFVDVLGMAEIDKPAVLATPAACGFAPGTESFTLASRTTSGPLVRRIRRSSLTTSMHSSSTWPVLAKTCNFPGFRRAYAHNPFGNRLELR